MIRLLNILFFGLAIVFFAVLALAMYKSVRYVNANQPFVLSQKKSSTQSSSTKSDLLIPPLSGNDTTTLDELPEIDFAAIDSLLDDEEELDSLINMTTDDINENQEELTNERSEILRKQNQSTNGALAEKTRRDGKPKNKTKEEELKDTEAIKAKTKDPKILNEKPKNDTKIIAESKTPSKKKATPTSYNQSGKYYIAVGAFKDRNNANVVQAQLKKLGFKNIKRIKNNNFTLIRLQGYPKKSSAAGDLTKVRKYYKEAYVRKR